MVISCHTGNDATVVNGCLSDLVLVVNSELLALVTGLGLNGPSINTCGPLQLLVGHLFAKAEEQEDGAGDEEAPSHNCRCRDRISLLIEEEECPHKDVEEALTDAREQKEEIAADAGHVDAGAHDDQAEEQEIDVEEQSAGVGEAEEADDLKDTNNHKSCPRNNVEVASQFKHIEATHRSGVVDLTLGTRPICLVRALLEVSSHFL